MFSIFRGSGALKEPRPCFVCVFVCVCQCFSVCVFLSVCVWRSAQQSDGLWFCSAVTLWTIRGHST